MPLIGDTRGVGRPVKQLNQAAARETIRFEHMLHGLVVGMRIRTHIAVMFDAPVDAVLRRTLGETRRGDPVDGHIRIVIQPGTIDIHIRRVDARTQCELDEHTFLAINRIDKQHGALRFDIVTPYAERPGASMNTVARQWELSSSGHSLSSVPASMIGFSVSAQDIAG